MSEQKRATLSTITTQKTSVKKFKDTTKTVRFTLTLPESNEKACPEYNYRDLLNSVEVSYNIKWLLFRINCHRWNNRDDMMFYIELLSMCFVGLSSVCFILLTYLCWCISFFLFFYHGCIIKACIFSNYMTEIDKSPYLCIL